MSDEKKQSTAIVLDSDNLVKRCIMATAMEDLKAGQTFTGGVFTSLKMLKGILEIPGLNPGKIVAFYDCGVPAFRKECIPGYKAKRKERRELLSDEEKEKAFKQVRLSKVAFEALGIKVLSYQDREADDGVAAAVRILSKQYARVVVVSSDRDLLQTHGMGADIWNYKMFVTEENFQEYVGVPHEMYVAYKAVIGDPSDEIPGAKGIAEGRAKKLFLELRTSDPYASGYSPREQLQALCAMVRENVRTRKALTYERALLDDEARLKDVIRGIDLSTSFGGTRSLRERLQEETKYNQIAFLKFCKSLSFKTILGDQRFTDIFREANTRQ